MLTLTSLGGTSLKITGAEKPVIVFPEAKSVKASQDTITLLGSPEEESTEGVVSWPGEYNTAGISMRGVGHNEGQQVSFVMQADGTRLAFLSSPLQDWTDPQIESVGDVDVLALTTDDAKLVQKLVDEFDPRILLLMPGKEHGAVVKAIGVKETTEEYKLKGQLPAEGREVVVLTR